MIVSARRSGLVALPLMAALALAGCSANLSLTAPPDEIAALAEDALEAQIGLRPQIDCGTDSIPLEQGSVVPCVLTDPNTGSVFDVDVTLAEVEGTRVTVSVQVADAPRDSAGDDTSSEQTSTGALALTSEEIAQTAATALAQTGEFTNPTVICPGSVHEVSPGYELRCTLIDGGDQRAVLVTIGSVEGDTYSVTVTAAD